MKPILAWLICCFAGFSTSVLAQTQEHTPTRHQVQLILSHTQLHTAVDTEGNRKIKSLPSWGINYNYQVAPRWKVGLHSDLIVEDFQVESYNRSETEVLDRDYPLAVAAVVSRQLGKHFQAMLGAGGEFASGENFFLFRAGLEYGYHFHENWELMANVTNDFKINAYNSWAIGIGVTRFLGKKSGGEKAK